MNLKTQMLAVLALGLCISAEAQKVVDVNNNECVTASMYNSVGGVPYINTKFTRLVEGSPFFSEKWQNGKITMSNGTVYENIPLRLDLYNNELQYKDSNDQEMITTGPVKEVLIDNNTGRHLFVRLPYALNDQTHKPHWYELVFDGKFTLYKDYRKDLVESKPYGSATYEQQIKTTELFYMVSNDRILELRKPKDYLTYDNKYAKELSGYIGSLDSRLTLTQKMVQTAGYLNGQLK